MLWHSLEDSIIITLLTTVLVLPKKSLILPSHQSVRVLEQVYENYWWETDVKAKACSPLPSSGCADVLNTCVTLWTHHTHLHTHHFPLKLLLRETQQLWSFLSSLGSYTVQDLYWYSNSVFSIFQILSIFIVLNNWFFNLLPGCFFCHQSQHTV